MTTYANKTGLPKPADGSKVWGPEFRGAMDYISAGLFPQYTYEVSPHFTTANLGNDGATDRRMFPTIQEAINAAQGDAYSWLNRIIVHPGVYQETLAISKSILITSPTLPEWGVQGGFVGALLLGAGGQSPLITITPPNSAAISVGFQNLSMYNQYAATASYINKPYLIDVRPQSLYDANPVWIGINGCCIRAQTWGFDNDWESMIEARGYNRILVSDCRVLALNYAGGHLNGGIRKLFAVYGDNANGKVAELKIRHTAISQYYTGAGSPCLFYADNKVAGVVVRSEFGTDAVAYPTRIIQYGATGTNVISGVTAAE
ncbi:MAG: hypothetical protein FD165_2893, partial [Gammaproteobacteria bacterium]